MGCGKLEQYPEDKANALVKKDDWNEFVITAIGQRITIDLNGTRIIDRRAHGVRTGGTSVLGEG